jgi:cephalosporin hydroxylase
MNKTYQKNTDADFSFAPSLARLRRCDAITGRSGKKIGLDGLSTVNNLITLRNLFLYLKPERTLEIGLALGGSAVVFCASHRDIGRKPENQHVAIDPYQEDMWDEVGIKNIEVESLENYIDCRIALSSIELPRLVSEQKTFNLVYIDGSHMFENVFIDVYYTTCLVPEGGVMLLDDSSDQQVAKVHRYIRRNLSEVWQEFDLRPFRKDLGKSLKYQIACALGRNQLVAYRKKSSGSRLSIRKYKDF